MAKAGGAPTGRSLLMFIGLLIATFACAPTALAAPANDDFADAEVLPATPPPSSPGNTFEATRETGEPDHAGDPGGHSVWFSWTPTSSGPVDISAISCFTSFDTTLAVYTGAAVDNLTLVAANDDGPPTLGCLSTESKVELNAIAGTTYRIAVDGFSGASGSFALRFDGRPGNDAFANAKALVSGLPTQDANATNKHATEETGEPDHASDPGGHSVWFSWTPSKTGPVEITTCSIVGSELDALLAVYTASAVDSLTPVASNDDGARSCKTTDSRVEFTAVAGTTYRIAVDGKGGSVGRFILNLEGPPPNDDFSSSVALGSSLPTSVGVFAPQLATKEVGEPNHAGNPGGHSTWASWTAAANGPIEISTCTNDASGIDTLLAVYTGAAVDSLTPVASNDDDASGCKATDSAVRFMAVAGATYRIAADGKGRIPGSFSVELRSTPANDAFAAAQAIDGGPLPVFAGANTRLAGKEPGEPDHAADPGGHSVWFTWTPASSGPVRIATNACGGELDTLLAVYTGSAVDALTQVASNDDDGSPACKVTDAAVELSVVAGTTYRIAVDGKGGSVGGFGLVIDGPPENDDLADAFTLSPGLPASVGIPANHLATKEEDEPDHAGNVGGHSIWGSWTAFFSGPVEISTCTNNASGIDTLLAVYTGTAVNSLTPVASNDDDASGCAATDSAVRFMASAGTTYRIAIDGKDGDTGSLSLRLSGVAANDDLAKATPLAAILPNGSSGSNRFATKQGGEPDHATDAGGASVWFKWTSPRSGPVSIDTCGTRFDTLLAVYTGAVANSLIPVASNDDGDGPCAPRSRLSFEAVASTTYKIAVDGAGGAQGNFELRIDPSPIGDDLDHARTIPPPLPRFLRAATVLGTKQAGEPDHAADPGGHSVWFAWTASNNGTVSLDTCSHYDFDTLLAVYTGSAVDALSQVASNDEAGGECGEGSRLSFEASAGTTYRIAVDGADGDSGHFGIGIGWLDLSPVAFLTVNRAGSGGGSVATSPTGIDCGSTCTHAFDLGTPLTLTAAADSGSVFSGWSGGGCSGTGSCNLTLNADTVVTAAFVPLPGGGGGEAGGGAPGGGGPSGGAPLPTPRPTPPKPVRCKPGFKKKLVRGKPRCVKKKKKQRHRPRGGGGSAGR